jgi:predicted 3-demethylubiquinone-9 3-methyltransferase (glyoxalase superfamily)
MKTRVLYKNGLYYPQFRLLMFYTSFAQHDTCMSHCVSFKTLKEAQEYIDKYFEAMRHKQTRQVFPYKTFTEYTDRVPRC